METFKAYRLGTVDYQEALNLQLSLLEKRKKEEIEDVLLLLEHPHTFTTGRFGKSQHLLTDTEELKRKRIHFEVVGRGGDITYHGPGQLVGYIILDLNKLNRNVHKYVRSLEEMIILALRDFGIQAERVKGLVGVWANGEKIASIGVGVKRWITYHGFALNVNTDLSYFDMIVPCGIQDVKITSIKKMLGKKGDVNMSGVETSITRAFSEVFNRKLSDTIFVERKALKGTFNAEFLVELERKLASSSNRLA